jgi:GH15 family glucan-1,4-alpha-glucosidase
MYGVGNERCLPELIVPWLAGYERSVLVRIGNDAAGQLQLDVFGAIADAILQTVKAGRRTEKTGHVLVRTPGRKNISDFSRRNRLCQEV